jgi:hypothetical protein
MKEQGPIGGKELNNLTRKLTPNTLGDRGDIFMSNQPSGPEIHLPPAGQEATQHLQNVAARAHTRESAPILQDRAISQAQILAARRAWAEANAGRTDITADERQAQEQAARMGLMPVPDETPEQKLEREQVGSSVRFSFEQKDIETIRRDPMKWLDEKFDGIYASAKKQGSELTSPQITQLQQMFSIGANHLSTWVNEMPNMTTARIQEFIEVYNARLNIMIMRSTIEHKNMDGAKQAAERLLSHGLFKALGLEDGKVNFMFARMGEKLEDARLAQEQLVDELSRTTDAKRREELSLKASKLHVSPEMISTLQDELIREQVDLAVRGIGDYSKIYEDAVAGIIGRVDASGEAMTTAQARALVQSQITRAVRTAYDAFVVSQRQAVLVARGHSLAELSGNYSADRFQSEPSVLFNMFNLEDLLTEKFGLFGPQARAFLKEMKLGIAESKLGQSETGRRRLEELARLPKAEREAILEDYGTRMFRDLYAAADLFSSGWKIDYMFKKIRENVGERTGLSGQALDERANDLALFLRLKRNISDTNNLARTDAWARIAGIRPEEMVRLYRERGVSHPELLAKLNEFFAGSAFDGYRANKLDAYGNPTTEIDGLRTYDKFKKEFGAVTQLLRQNGYKEMRALRIGRDGFSQGERGLITKYFNGDVTKAEQLQRMFAHFSAVAARPDTINTLMSDKFEDIYTRTLLVDDALLDILDREDPEGKITSLSATWTPGSEVAQDPLVRNFGDLEHFAKAAGNLIGFIGTENTEARLKAAMTFGEEASQYNGLGISGKSDCIRYTAGVLLEVSEIPFFWDAMGIGKLPFRQVMTGVEKIYGPQAETKSRGDLRHDLDMMRSSITPEAYKELERLLEVRGGDTAKLRGLSLIFFLVFAVFVEGAAVLDVGSLTPGGKK